MSDTRSKMSAEERQAEALSGYNAYRGKEAATHVNMLRLRSERLAREAANPPEVKAMAAKPKLRKRTIRS
jgi:hypothetical protein